MKSGKERLPPAADDHGRPMMGAPPLPNVTSGTRQPKAASPCAPRFVCLRQPRIPHSRVTAIIKGRQGITATTALKLGKYFGTPPEYWLNLQHMHDLAAAREEQGDALSKIRPLCA